MNNYGDDDIPQYFFINTVAGRRKRIKIKSSATFSEEANLNFVLKSIVRFIYEI
jgi:hypothetical protein